MELHTLSEPTPSPKSLHVHQVAISPIPVVFGFHEGFVIED